MSTITGFIDCDSCGYEHAPVSGRCPFRIEKDAAYVLDASGTALTREMIENLIEHLKKLRGDRPEPYRPLLPEVQLTALIRSRWNSLFGSHPSPESERAVREETKASKEWVIDNTLPPDMFIVEWPDMFGVLKKLAVPDE